MGQEISVLTSRLEDMQSSLAEMDVQLQQGAGGLQWANRHLSEVRVMLTRGLELETRRRKLAKTEVDESFA
eukprot:6027266-Prorocentrum_lima.AAC.1